MGARFFGWVAYTLQRSERRDSPSENWRPFDTDQTHNLIVLGQYRITPKWSLGVRWRFVTGNPETPVTGAIYEADRNTTSPRLAPLTARDNQISRSSISESTAPGPSTPGD